MEHPESYMDSGKLDLTLPENLDVVEDLSEEGELGQFLLALLDEAKKDNKPLFVEGFGTQDIAIEYNGQKVHFYMKPSLDHGNEPVVHTHYALRTRDFKQPWVRDAIQKTPENGWLEIIPVTLSELSEAVAGTPFDLANLERRYPNVSMPDIMDAIAEETADLGEFFTFQTVGGLEFVRLHFRDENLRERYLADDPQILEQIRAVLAPALSRIHSRLDQINRKTA